MSHQPFIHNARISKGLFYTCLLFTIQDKYVLTAWLLTNFRLPIQLTRGLYTTKQQTSFKSTTIGHSPSHYQPYKQKII